jgi:uncharacterized membrane-anchored protein YjiN (DUF445 family)
MRKSVYASVAQEDEHRKERELNRMKRRATGLFIGVTVVFAATFLVRFESFWIDLLRATMEASMVGALADWFAVTALFRYPLGLKIPHTAIISTRKNLFGERLGRFIQYNFLTGDVIIQKLRGMHLSKRIAESLSHPDHSAQIAQFVTAGLSGTVQMINDRYVQAFIGNAIHTHLTTVQLTPVFGQLIKAAMTPEKKRDLLTGLLGLSERLVKEHEAPIRARIAAETPWWMPVSIDEKVYLRLLTLTERVHQEVAVDPVHPLHGQFAEVVDRFTDDLHHSTEMIDKGEAIKHEILETDLIRDTSEKLWQEIKGTLINPDGADGPPIQETVHQGLMQIGAALSQNRAWLNQIEDWIEEAVRHILHAYGDEVGRLIAHTVHQWDPALTARKVELQVGRDLQYIRINGTVIGGLAGMVIHLITLAL